MRPLARRMGRLGTETAFEVLARARALEAQGRHIVHLEIGEPDFDTPRAITAAGIAAIERGETHYTPSAGIIELREAIASYLSRTRALSYDASQIVVAPGAKPIMFYAILALVEAGDEAIYPDPGFPIYSSMIDFAGGTPVPLALREENDYVPDLDELRRLVTAKTKLIILNSPHNPTGGALSKEAVREIARLARDNDIWVLSDEIYADLLYDGKHHPIGREEGMLERTIVLDGFSKTFAMTGWRLGYGAFPKPLVEPVTKLVTNSVSCTATFTQRAGIVALSQRPPEVDEMVKAFRTRRDAIVAGLNKIEGVTCRTPAGAFYVFPNITGLRCGNAATVAGRVLIEAGVAVLAGTAFGPIGEGHLRLSYANSLENLELAVQRIAEWAKTARPAAVRA
ncbi:MAG: pyridoxal phosphate-dependent aminotransferase [Chloroflexi bacterium]|nr:MAG: pyridoxal phosphate-dependent aminotransferase [Chloroflexota bacterium]